MPESNICACIRAIRGYSTGALGIIHDFVMLSALANTAAARGTDDSFDGEEQS
jgi:hypothetical protein